MITQDILKETFSRHKARYEGKMEDYFAPLYISDKHGKSVEDSFEFSVFGNDNGGIDGYYIDKEARNLYLYFFSWSEDHSSFEPAYRQLIGGGMEMIFGEGNVRTSSDPAIKKLRYELEEYKAVVDRVYLLFVFNGDTEKANQSKVLDSLKEDLENKRYLIDRFFERDNISFSIDYKSNFSKTITTGSKSKKANIFEINFEAGSVQKAPGGELMVIGLLKLGDLHNMFIRMRSRLFEKNIRSGLSADNAPNRAIKKALKEIVLDKSLDPQYFTFNHNGVTLYAEMAEYENGMMRIVEPRVLNGAQTITTFAKFIEDNNNNPVLDENRARLGKIRVIAKVITEASAEFITSVTISNNRQNPVEPWNLRASDMIQCAFEDKFNAHGKGIHYDRQEGAFVNMTDEEKDEKGIMESKEINIRKLAQTFLAIQGEVDKISRLSDVFENENLYANTFRQAYLKADARKIVVAYKIHFRLPSIIRSIEEKGYNKYFWTGYARNLVWALLIQGILNDEKSEACLEDFVNSLSFENNYGLFLKDIASSRIRFILSDLADQPKYRSLLEEEPPRYSFLRTRAVFQEAMIVAKKRFGWEKKSIS